MNRLAAIAVLAGCKGHPVVTIIEADHNALAVTVAVTEDEPVHAQGRCESDAGEVRILDRQGPDELLDLPLAGMLPDSTWTCEVEVDRGDRVKTYTIEAAARTVPVDVGVYQVEGSSDPSGMTLISEFDHGRGHPNVRTTLIDHEGNLRWYRFTDFDVNAGLDSNVTDTGMVLVGGGPDHPPTWYDSVGNQRFVLGEPPIPGAYHHHAEPVDGGVLTLVNARNTRSNGSEFTGFGIVHYNALGTPEWTWNSQQAVDAGTLVPGAADDAFHANSVSLVDDPLGPAAWVSLYLPRTVVRIDRDTGEVTHTLGAGGDFSLVDATGAALPDTAWFVGQHDPEFAWPRVLLYDNGMATQQSRAVELELDLDALTATLVWEWSEPNWFEPVFGDADRVADDRVLLTRGRCWDGFCGVDTLDDDRRGDIVEVDETGEVQWRLFGASSRGMYRAERVDPCLLWNDPRHCQR